MSPLVSPEVTSAHKIVIKHEIINSTALVADSEPTTSSDTLPHRTVTQKVESITKSVISDQVTNDRSVTHAEHATEQISLSKSMSSLTETDRKLTIAQEISEEDEKFRSKNHHKFVHQKPNNPSPSAAQNLIQTVARMYTSRSTTPEILKRFQVRNLRFNVRKMTLKCLHRVHV